MKIDFGRLKIGQHSETRIKWKLLKLPKIVFIIFEKVVKDSKDSNGRIRKYIIPSKEPNIYPKILTKKEYDYFRERSKSGLITKEEQEAAQMAIEKEKDRLVAESMARKEAIRKIDMQKTKDKASRLDDVEAEARRRTMHLLERAYNLKLEQEEEIQMCNRLILETKCRAIRDAQVGRFRNAFFLDSINQWFIVD